MDTELINAAKAAIEAGQVTQDGKPLVTAMETVLNRGVRAEERDAAYDAILAEGAEPDPDRKAARWVYTGPNTRANGVPVLRHTVFIGGLPAYMAELEQQCKKLGG